MKNLERMAELFSDLEAEVIKLVAENNSGHPLQDVFDQCVAQAETGKGEERHGHGDDFMDQPWVDLTNSFGLGGPLFQASKKMREAVQFLGTTDDHKFKTEMLGAINYAAMAVLAFDLAKVKAAEQSVCGGECGGCDCKTDPRV
jgi:hypothetical protein